MRGGVQLYAKHGLLIKCRINNSGTGNTIIVEDGCILRNCIFNIYGNYNTVKIGANVTAINAIFHLEDDKNVINIGEKTKICGKTEFACLEGTEIIVGKNCLFSSDIHFRTGDSHSVLNLSGNRINPSSSICIHDHVWIGQRATILKGVSVSENSIIGIDAVVTKKFEENNIAIGGNPAKVIKRDIDWNTRRIPISDS